MSVSDDVGNLFRRFGGDAGQYQEVARDDDAKHAALRWPLLNALDIAHTEAVPDAGRAGPSTAALAQRAEPEASAAPAHTTHAATAPAVSDAAGPARAPLFARGHRHASMPPPVAQAEMGASRFSSPAAAASSPDRANAAANAPSMSAAPAAGSPDPVAPTSPVQASPASPPAPSAPHAAAPQREAPPVQTAPFFPQEQTFARPPFNSPVVGGARPAPSAPTRQESGSILSGLFGGTTPAPTEPAAHASSKDLATLFARLSRGPAVPARPPGDPLRSRLKADGDA